MGEKGSEKGAEFLKGLPHRYPMRLVDAILELDHERVKAVKNVTINEPFFPGHFPGTPLMPGVLIVEALAQASVILSMNIYPGDTEGVLGLLTGVDKARFRRPVVPGDRLILMSHCTRTRGDHYNFETSAYVDDDLVAEARLRSMLKQF